MEQFLVEEQPAKLNMESYKYKHSYTHDIELIFEKFTSGFLFLPE